MKLQITYNSPFETFNITAISFRITLVQPE